LTEVYAHRWDEHTQASIGGGLTAQRFRQDSTFGWGNSVLPNGTASFTHTISLEQRSTINLSAGAGLGTGYNAVNGHLLYGVTGVTSAGWTYDTFGVTAAATYGQSLHFGPSDPDTTRSVGASLTATYTPAPVIDFQAGARISWQIVPTVPNGPIINDQALWVLFVGLGLRAPPLLF
jgi:hypothetical protein